MEFQNKRQHVSPSSHTNNSIIKSTHQNFNTYQGKDADTSATNRTPLPESERYAKGFSSQNNSSLPQSIQEMQRNKANDSYDIQVNIKFNQQTASSVHEVYRKILQSKKQHNYSNIDPHFINKERKLKQKRNNERNQRKEFRQPNYQSRGTSMTMYNAVGNHNQSIHEQERKNKFIEKQNIAINEFWNGKDRSNSIKRNEWYIIDYYQQKNNGNAFTTPSSPRRDNKSGQFTVDPQHGVFEKDLRDLSITKFENKAKLNNKVFASQIKNLFYNEEEVLKSNRQPSKEQIQFSKKKNKIEYQKNSEIFGSNGVGRLLSGDQQSAKKGEVGLNRVSSIIITPMILREDINKSALSHNKSKSGAHGLQKNRSVQQLITKRK